MATERLRAVFDTNVVIAALKSRNPRSPTVELISLWEAGKFDLLYSDGLRAEYERTCAARAVDPTRSKPKAIQCLTGFLSAAIMTVAKRAAK